MANTDWRYTFCMADIPVPGNETFLQAKYRQNIYKIRFVKYYWYYFISNITALLFSFFCFSTIIQSHERDPDRIFFEISIYHG